MVRAFSIDEIFPDVDAEAVRLPRRQAGSSPQGLAVTLVADYTLPARAWLPSATIVSLLGEFGVTSGAARTAISRLGRRGVLEGRQDGRYTFYRLTQPAALDLSYGGMSVGRFAAYPEAWDGWWTFIAFSLPQEKRTQRRGLRTELRWRGYAPLYDGVWLSPHPLMLPAGGIQEAATTGELTVFRAQQADLELDSVRNPVDAWDVEGIAYQYETFIRRWSDRLADIAAGRVTGVAAVLARTEVMDIYRRFPSLDPTLPAELMPPDWPRDRAREVFLAVYDGLARPAEQYVRTVVESMGGEAGPDVRAHTVAEMADGILGPQD